MQREDETSTIECPDAGRMMDESLGAADGSSLSPSPAAKLTVVPESPVRQDLVSTAVSFLLNARVREKPDDEKRIFLIRKGLTPHEIDVAIDCASRGVVFSSGRPEPHFGKERSLPSDQWHEQSCPQPQLYRHEILYQYPGTLAMTRALVPSLLLMSGIFYAAYLLYQKLQLLMFGEKQEKHPLVLVQESLVELRTICESLEKSMHGLEEKLMANIRKEMETLSRPSAGEVAAVNEIKKELSSVKALLLGRKQFPESPSLTHVSIPAWQLTDDSKERQ